MPWLAALGAAGGAGGAAGAGAGAAGAGAAGAGAGTAAGIGGGLGAGAAPAIGAGAGPAISAGSLPMLQGIGQSIAGAPSAIGQGIMQGAQGLGHGVMQGLQGLRNIIGSMPGQTSMAFPNVAGMSGIEGASMGVPSGGTTSAMVATPGSGILGTAGPGVSNFFRGFAQGYTQNFLGDFGAQPGFASDLGRMLGTPRQRQPMNMQQAPDAAQILALLQQFRHRGGGGY